MAVRWRWLAAVLVLAAACSGGGSGTSTERAGDAGPNSDERFSDSRYIWRGVGRAEPPSGVFVDVAVRQHSSCGVRDTGELVCWGDYGAVPDGRFEKVSLSDGHGCALAIDGSVACWGSNKHGQLDAPDGRFTQVSAGPSTSCGVAVGGSVVCWGAGGDLEVPVGEFVKTYARSLCGLRTDGELVCWGHDDRNAGLLDAPGGEFITLSMTGRHACGLRSDGVVWCWGLGSPFGQQPAVAAAGEFVAVSVGYGHGCALGVGGDVVCWGANDEGQAEPQPGPFAQVTAGSGFTCALDPSGNPSCWGKSWAGELGLGSRGDLSRYSDWEAQQIRQYDRLYKPEPVFTRISAGAHFVCGILTSNSSVACWDFGRFDSGDLLAGPRGFDFVDVSSGAGHACALKVTGQAVCWGHQHELQEIYSSAPEPHYSEVSYSAIAVSASTACGQRSDGTRHCWAPYWSVPAPAGQFARLAAGPCGIRPAGHIECWGYNQNLGEPPDSIGPLIDVAADGSYSCGIQATTAAIVCWDPHTNKELLRIEGDYVQASKAQRELCALDTHGALKCWDLYPTPAAGPQPCGPRSCWARHSRPPIDLPTGAFTKVAVADDHACAIVANGTIDCWGSNYERQTRTLWLDEPPVDLADLRWWLAVAALAATGGIATAVAHIKRRWHRRNTQV